MVSPSDFGFHNALLRPDGRWVFFDFEYGGWDDIAKLVNDVFLQPAVPVPFDLFEPFLDRVIGNDPTERRRISLLRPVFAVKWCCIMLNPFLPDTAARGAFADPGTDAATRRTTQLEKARAAFQRLTEMI